MAGATVLDLLRPRRWPLFACCASTTAPASPSDRAPLVVRRLAPWSRGLVASCDSARGVMTTLIRASADAAGPLRPVSLRPAPPVRGRDRSRSRAPPALRASSRPRLSGPRSTCAPSGNSPSSSRTTRPPSTCPRRIVNHYSAGHAPPHPRVRAVVAVVAHNEHRARRNDRPGEVALAEHRLGADVVRAAVEGLVPQHARGGVLEDGGVKARSPAHHSVGCPVTAATT